MKLNNHGWGLVEMLVISGILLLLLFLVAIYIYSFYNKLDFNSAKDYATLESKLQIAAIKYTAENNLINGRVTSDTLESMGYMETLRDKKNNSCTGYVVFNGNNYNSYISCPNYTSDGYNVLTN